MKFRFTIARKLGVGFGMLTLFFILNTVFTFLTLNKSREANEKIADIYAPSASYLSELYEIITNSKLLIKNWVFIDQAPDTPDKIKLKKLHEEDFPELNEKLIKISKKWEADNQANYKNIMSSIKDTLFVYHKLVMDMLSNFESYDDPMIRFEIDPMVEEGGEIMFYTNNILTRLSTFIDEQNKLVNEARDNMVKSFDNFQQTIIYLGVIILIAVIVIAFLTTRSLVKPIQYMKNILFSMGKGIIPNEKIRESKDEIGEMASALNQLIKGLNQISDFAAEIGKGNFNSEFEPLSDQDKLGISIIDMRENLKKADEEDEKRKIEDEHRSWSSHGIAMFSDILRKNNDNIEVLSYDIISNLVKYIEANQGGLFLINKEDLDRPFIELKACYAFDRKKTLEKKIEMGIGLLGRCVQEKEVIYLTDIPENYINISSGLGNEIPRSLLIVPLMLNDDVYGVIELASFNPIEKYKIEFTIRLGESIASTVATVNTNIQTSNLLDKTKIQAEEMASQEEEMRQNMEELQATQEEYERREEELKIEIKDLKRKLANLSTKNEI